MENVIRNFYQLKINGTISPQLHESILLYKLKNLRTHDKYTITHNFDDELTDNLLNPNITPDNYPVYDCKFSPFENSGHICNIVNEMGFLISLNTREPIPHMIAACRSINKKGYPVFTIDWGFDNNTLITTNSDKIIGFYDASNHKTITEIPVKFSARCAVFNPWNNNFVLVGGRSNSIALIDFRSKTQNEFAERIKLNKKSHPPVVSSVAFVGEHYFASCTDRLNYISIWDSRYIKNRPFSNVSYYGESSSVIGYSHLATDTSSLYTACTDNAVYKFDIPNVISNNYNKEKPKDNFDSGHILQQQPIAKYMDPSQAITPIIKLDVCVQKRLLLCGSQNNALILWDADRPSTPIARIRFKSYSNNVFPGNIPAFGGAFSRHTDALVVRSCFSLCVWKPQFDTKNDEQYSSLDFSPTYNQSFDEVLKFRKEEIRASDKVGLEKKLPKNYNHYSSFVRITNQRRIVDPDSVFRNNIWSLYDLLNNFPRIVQMLQCDDSLLNNSKNYFIGQFDEDDELEVCTIKELKSFFYSCEIDEISIDKTSLKMKIFYTLKENSFSAPKKPKLGQSIISFFNKNTPQKPMKISLTNSVEYGLIYID